MNSNRPLIILLLNEFARESVRTFSYGLLILSLLLPTAPATASSAAPAPAAPLAANEEPVAGPAATYDANAVDKKLRQLAELSYEIEADETPEYGKKMLRKQASRLVEALETEIGREMTAAEQAGKAEKAPPEAAKRLADAEWHWLQLQNYSRNSQVDAHGRMLIDPSGPVNSNNVVDFNVHAEQATAQQLKDESPERMSDRMKNWAAGGYHGAIHFTNEMAVFSLATGLHSLWQAGMQGFGAEDVTDPLVLENWEKQTFSLLGAAGFAVFMGANHSVMHLYHHAKLLIAERQLSKQAAGMLFSYIGMTAGLLVQSMFTDFATDKNVWDCLRPYYNSNASTVPHACENMRATWINSGKILNYFPSAVSMIGAAGISTVVRLGINWGGATLAQTGAGQVVSSYRRNLVANGIKVIHKSELPKLLSLAKTVPGANKAASMLRFLPKYGAGIGDLLFFLVVNDSVTDDFVKSRMQDIRMNYVDPNAWMMKHLNYHTDFFWPAAGTYQPLRNAFDAEATNTWGAHNYLMDLYRTMQKNGWQDPGTVETCAPKEVQEALKKASGKKDDKPVLLAKKTDEQLACEVLHQPKALLERYGKVNAEWRGILLDPYIRSVNNWVEMIDQFYTVYRGTQTLAYHLGTQKFRMTYKGQTDAPDLSREALAKLIAPEEQEGAAAPAPMEGARPHNAFLDNTWVPTPELVDFVIAGFACGPDPQLDTNAMNRNFFSRFFDDFYSYFARRTVSESYLTTPWGSSIHFVPPKMTNKSRQICENVSRDMYGTVNYMLGNPFPERDKDHPSVKNPFGGPFYDEDGKMYPSLADFVFKNMDPEIYKQVNGGNGAANWWIDHFKKPVAAVWDNYIKVYNSFIEHKYLPALFDNTYRGGCRQAVEMSKDTPKAAASELESFSDSQPACANSSTAYRVANGYFLSIELETKNYLRGLYSLYSSTFDKSELTPAAKNQFMQLANGLLQSIRARDPKSMMSRDFDTNLEQAQQLADQLIGLVDSRLKAKPENKFRAEMLEQFKAQLGSILTDEAGQMQVVKRINMFDANYSGPGKKLDTSHSISPNKRH